MDQTGGRALSGKADYITAVDFDGDWDTSNNWESIAKAEHKAAAVCYYSVVATKTHWFILYAFYHPRDWADHPAADLFGADEHENDMEGLLVVAQRPSKPSEDKYGRLLGVVTVFHTNFFSYAPKGSPLKGGDEDIDGTLEMEEYNGAAHPVTAQEAKGHGLKAWPQVLIDGDGIKYFPTLDEAGVPTGPDDRNVKYKLVNIFAKGGLWERREQKETFSAPGTFAGGGANAPWGWDDGDDGNVSRGDFATDPAKLIDVYFEGLSSFSKEYESNLYRP